MVLTLRERTVVPPDDLADLVQLLDGLHGDDDAKAQLLCPDGSRLDIPDAVYRLLNDAVVALSNGIPVSVAPHNTLLTTQEAADLLDVSRPTLVRLLAAREIPFSTRGRRRRVQLHDLLEYRERARVGRDVPDAEPG
ncbi:helix-turn-helix domain-containing protein [Nocardia thailandica]